MSSGNLKTAFEIEEIYRGLNKKLLKKSTSKWWFRDRILLASKIFKDCLYDILFDIINNNVTFVLPLRFGNYAEIYIKQFSDEDFKKQYKMGRFKRIDYIQSQFTGNQLRFKYSTKTVGYKEKNIYVTGELRDLLEKYTNEFKQYY